MKETQKQGNTRTREGGNVKDERMENEVMKETRKQGNTRTREQESEEAMTQGKCGNERTHKPKGRTDGQKHE